MRVNWEKLAGDPKDSPVRACAALGAHLHNVMWGRIAKEDAPPLWAQLCTWTENTTALSALMQCSWFWLLLGHVSVHRVCWPDGTQVPLISKVIALAEKRTVKLDSHTWVLCYFMGFFRAMPERCSELILQRLGSTAFDAWSELRAAKLVDSAFWPILLCHTQAVLVKEKCILFHVLNKIFEGARRMGDKIAVGGGPDVTKALQTLLKDAIQVVVATDKPEIMLVPARQFVAWCLGLVESGHMCGPARDGVCILQVVLNTLIRLCSQQVRIPVSDPRCRWMTDTLLTLVRSLCARHWAEVGCPHCIQTNWVIFRQPAPLIRLVTAYNQYRDRSLSNMIALAATVAIQQSKEAAPQEYGDYLFQNHPHQSARVVLRAVYNNMCDVLDLAGPGELDARKVSSLLCVLESIEIVDILGCKFRLQTNSERQSELARAAANIVKACDASKVLSAAFPRRRYQTEYTEAQRVAAAIRLILAPTGWNEAVPRFHSQHPHWNIVPVVKKILAGARPEQLAAWHLTKRQRCTDLGLSPTHLATPAALPFPISTHGLFVQKGWQSEKQGWPWLWQVGGQSFLRWAESVLICASRRRQRYPLERGLPPEIVILIIERGTITY